jgi:hypothetical protein
MENADEPMTPTNGAAAKLPPITVLLLTYNEEKHLGRAIESVRPFGGACGGGFVLDRRHGGHRPRAGRGGVAEPLGEQPRKE